MVDSLWALFLWRFQKHTDRSDRVHWTILPLRFFSAFLRRPSWFFFLSLEKRKTDLPAEFTQYIGCSSNGKNIGVSWRFWIKTRPLFGTHPFWWTKPDFSKRRFRFQNSPFFLFRLLRTSDFPPDFSAWMKVACLRIYEKESNILHWIPENNGKSFFLFFPPESGPRPGENFNTPNLLSEVRFLWKREIRFFDFENRCSSRNINFRFRKAVFCFLPWKTDFLLCTCSAVWSLLSSADFFFICFYSIVATAGGSEGTKLPERDSLFIFLLF